MSAVRHVSSRGHGVFNMRANRTGNCCLCGCPVTSRAVASFENKIGRGRPLDWPERVHMNPFGTCRASAKQECEHTRSKTKMKSLIVPIVGLAKTKTLSNLSVVILGVISPLAFADVGTWSLDSTI